MVAFEPKYNVCLQCVFWKNLKFWFFYECLTILRRENFCTAYSVHVGDFLPLTQYSKEIFYRILSTRRRFFTAYSVHMEYFLPHTQYTWNIFYRILSSRGIISNFAILLYHLLCKLFRNNFYRPLSRRGIIFSAYSVGGE